MSSLSDSLQKLNESELNAVYQKTLSKANRQFRKEKLSDYWLWTKAVWTTAKGKPLEFENRKYLVDIYKDNHPNIVIMKAAQMGISERLISEAVWFCDQKGLNTLYTFPAQSHLADFVQARLEPVLATSPYFSQRLEESDQYVQKVGLKRIGDGFLYMRGSQNEKQIVTIDADLAVLDERDRFVQENVPYIDKRLLASDVGWRREVSTPTFPGNPERNNNIHAAYINSDQHVWEIRCDKCKTWQELDFFNNVNFKRKWAVCSNCGKKIDRLKDGRWMAKNPDSSIRGYKVNGIYNPTRTTADLIKQYKQASTFSAKQQFYNQVLGLPYEFSGQRLQDNDLDSCKREFSIPANEEGCFAGADVGNKIHVVVSKKLEGDRARYVWIGTVNKFLGPQDSIEALMNKYNIKCLVIDARPETRKVKDLAGAFPGRVYGAYYPTKDFSLKEYFAWDDIKGEVQLDRTISLDYLVSDIKNQNIELPENVGVVPRFYKEMTSSVRVMERNERKGIDVAKWVEAGPDHFFHAANYDRIARLQGTAGDALLEYYKEPSEESEVSNMLKWVRLRGQRIF